MNPIFIQAAIIWIAVNVTIGILLSFAHKKQGDKIIMTLDDILKAEAEETAALTAETAVLASLKAAVNAVPPAIQSLKDQLATGNPIQPADLDKIVQAMHVATQTVQANVAEETADAETLNTATAPNVPPAPPVEPLTSDTPPSA